MKPQPAPVPEEELEIHLGPAVRFLLARRLPPGEVEPAAREVLAEVAHTLRIGGQPGGTDLAAMVREALRRRTAQLPSRKLISPEARCDKIEELSEALRGMDLRQRRALMLYYRDGLPLAAAARQAGVREEHLHSLRDRLRALFRACG